MPSDDWISEPKTMLSLLYLHVRNSIQDKYTIELRDRVTGHGVFQCVLLSSDVLNKFCSLVLKRLYSFEKRMLSELGATSEYPATYLHVIE